MTIRPTNYLQTSHYKQDACGMFSIETLIEMASKQNSWAFYAKAELAKRQ